MASRKKASMASVDFASRPGGSGAIRRRRQTFRVQSAATGAIRRNTGASVEMSEETWPVRYARLDQSFDRREWRQQYEQQ
jgi:hypothetical protein